MRRLLGLLIVAGSLMAASVEDQIKELEKKWAEATTKNDFSTLEKVLADELIYTHSSGTADTKREFIDNLKKKIRVYERLDYDSVSVKVIGNTALLNAQGKLKVVTKGAPSEFKIAFLHVFMKRGADWQLVAHQSARLQ